MTINCAVECVNGCKLGDQCPNQAHAAEASKFIQATSLDSMLAMAEEAVRRKAMERAHGDAPTQWVFPEDGIRPEDL
jgi:hypothetical protein